MVDFLFVIMELFCYLLRLSLRRYKQKSVEVGVLLRGWVTLSANFRRKGASPTNYCFCQKNRGLPFRVVSKYVWFCHKAHVTERQTDRTENYDSQDRADILRPTVKTISRSVCFNKGRTALRTLTSDHQETTFTAYCMLLPTGTDLRQQLFSWFRIALPRDIKRTKSKISITSIITEFLTDTLYSAIKTLRKAYFSNIIGKHAS